MRLILYTAAHRVDIKLSPNCRESPLQELHTFPHGQRNGYQARTCGSSGQQGRTPLANLMCPLECLQAFFGNMISGISSAHCLEGQKLRELLLCCSSIWNIDVDWMNLGQMICGWS
jgi:hypothetical protein